MGQSVLPRTYHTHFSETEYLHVCAYVSKQVKVKAFVPNSQREGREKGVVMRASSVGQQQQGLLLRNVPALAIP